MIDLDQGMGGDIGHGHYLIVTGVFTCDFIFCPSLFFK